MAFWHPPEGSESDPRWWDALSRVAELTRGSPAYWLLVPCEFMFMGRIDEPDGTRIWLYKHKWRRTYINLDDAGRAWRYVPPRNLRTDYSGQVGRSRPRTDTPH